LRKCDYDVPTNLSLRAGEEGLDSCNIVVLFNTSCMKELSTSITGQPQNAVTTSANLADFDIPPGDKMNKQKI